MAYFRSQRTTFFSLFFIFCFHFQLNLAHFKEIQVRPGEVRHIHPGVIYKISDSQSDYKSDTELTIFCWSGQPKSPLSIWKSATVNLNIEGDFTIYSGENDTHVKYQHKMLQEAWFSFLPWKEKVISITPFNNSCTGVFTKEDYSIRLDLRQLNFNRLLIFLAGLILFFISPSVCEKAIFHYTSGTLIGVLGSVLIVVYLLSRLFPKKSGAVAVLVGGSSVVMFIVRSLWENCYSILRQYHYYVVAYLVTSSIISFAVCYRFGPLTDSRSLHLLQWGLQAAGLISVFISSEYKEAVTGVIIAILCVYNFPRSWVFQATSLWRQRFPPKVRPLTEDEYFEQGRQETKKALDELRLYCQSPKCNPWQTVGRLKDPLRLKHRSNRFASSTKRNCVEFISPPKARNNKEKRWSRSSRFAEFVEGASHLSDREVLDYETETLLPNDDAETWTDDDSQGSE